MHPHLPAGDTPAACPRCEREMTYGVSCCDCPWRQNGKVIPPIPFGTEPWDDPSAACHDCNTPRGGTHHYGCDNEACPHGNQAITCDVCQPIDDPYAPKAN